ncbi:MAG TPA: flagellar filament capping protein FliD [Rhodocyclaceae bacterium]|nr:flagellar filament capping protein FliD [Rhodocyclaceae bacterium]
MATGTVSSLGVGSGIDLDSLLTQLMAAERQPIDDLNTQETSFKSQLSVYGTLNGALSTLQTAASAMSTEDKFAAFQANVADTTIASAAAGTGAVAGTYSLEVDQLALAQKVKSGGYAGADSTIATGTLTLQVGSVSGSTFTADATQTKTITIDSSNNTLQGLRDAINASGANVSATIVNDGSSTPYRLVLTSKNSGTANTFKLSGLTDLNYDPVTATGSGSATGLSNIQSAQDALLKVDGINVTKSSNVVTDAIQGVTLTLAKTSAVDPNTGLATPTTVSITRDNQSITTKINTFISAYNAVVTQISSQSKYDPTTQIAGPLNGDSTARSIQSQLRNIIGGTLTGGTGGLARLADAGINIAVDGTLSVDNTKLTAALNDPTKDVGALFAKVGSVSGFADQISNAVTSFQSDSGILTARTQGINTTLSSMDSRIAELETQMTAIEDRYRQQFTDLDSTVASLNSTGSFLTQQLSKLL